MNNTEKIKDLINGKKDKNLIYRKVKLFNRHQNLIFILDKTTGKVDYFYENKKDGDVAYKPDRGFFVNTCKDCGETFLTTEKDLVCSNCRAINLLGETVKLSELLDLIKEFSKDEDKPKAKPTNKSKDVDTDTEPKNELKPTIRTRATKSAMIANLYIDTLDEVYTVNDLEKRKESFRATHLSQLIPDNTILAIINMLYRNEDTKTMEKKLNLKPSSLYRYIWILNEMGIAYSYQDKKGDRVYKLFDSLNIVKVR